MNRRLKKSRYNDFKRFIISMLFIFILSLFVGTFIYVDKSLTPAIKVLAETKAEEIANRSINKAVGEIISGNLDYNDLMITQINSEGKVSMIQSNTVFMNEIASEVALEIQNELKQVKSTTSYIPIGTALNSPILAKYGPQLKVTIEPIGTVYVDFMTEFEDAGINQTRHRIYLEVKARVNIVVPLTTQTKEVKSQVPICETIIIGDVPNSYVNVPDSISPNMYPTE
ncbi:MAG: sporulation protein YunB [Peptostreptococcaceae bacterium]